MPNVVNTQKKLEQLASDLDGSHATTATHLRELSAAVGGDVSAEDWAATNLQQVINPEALAEGIKARALPPIWLRRLEWLRNILIFAPLAFTWLAISQATDKYQALLTNNNTLTGQPFLLLWQQGFNHTLWGPFILSNLAFWDSFMLAAILILTGIVNWRYSINHAQAEQKADQLREDITLALGDATLCLTTAQRVSRLQLQQQPKDTEAVVKLLFDFIKEFKRTTDEFLKELAAERQQRGSLNDFQLVVERLSNDMISAANSMTRSNSELITLIKDLTGPIKTIPALVATVVQVEADLRAITSSLGQLVTDQANQWNTLQITLTTKLDELLRTQNQIGQELTQEQKRATQELQTMLDQAFTNLQTFGQAFHTMLDTSLQQLINEQKLLGGSLIDAADTLEDSTKTLTTQVKSIDNFVKYQEKTIAALELQLIAQKNITEQLIHLVAETGLILKSTRESAPELRSMAVDIDKLNNALRMLPLVLEKELLLPLKHYSSAAAKIDTGVEMLEKAAVALYHAADRLHGEESTGATSV